VIGRRNEGEMTGGEREEAANRGQVLVHLRHGIRETSRLAEQLASDAIVGSEALGLLGRLQAIRAELDASSFTGSDLRRGHNDPFWNEPPHPFQLRG
jgi:hypothetical protein